MGVFYIGDRVGRGGVFRRLCVGMILGWDFYWFGVGRCLISISIPHHLMLVADTVNA